MIIASWPKAGETDGRELADLDPSPPYDEMAKAQGAHAERVEKPADLPAALARARDAVRALRQAEPDRDILVLLRNGTYPIEGPVDFSPEDSGRAGGRITYAAASGATPVISGGRRITGFEPCGDGV